ncbi:TM2 domain-containing protein [Streptomyces sp. NPDC059850]|uniref:TM2 domain-containing protein n=1 Tax=Streptomyces sp. NPDC059850 TaxID=3346970 RepID=UPI003650B8A2
MSNQNPYSQPPGPQQSPYGYPQQGQQPGPQQPPYGYPQQGQQPYGYPAAPGMHQVDPNAPFGYDRYGRPYSDKSKIAAGLLQLFLGFLGVGRFYTGHVGIAFIQLFTCGGAGIWALIDAIMMLASDNFTDKRGRPLRA